MRELDRRKRLIEEAWIGDAVLCLYIRTMILRQDGAVDGAKCSRLTSNQFLAMIGEPTQVEAQVGRVYDGQGLEAAFAWIEQNLIPLFERVEQRRQLAGKRRDSQK